MGGAAGIVGSVVSTGLGMMAQKREIEAQNRAIAASNAAAEYNAQVYEQQAGYNKAGYEAQAESARTRGAFDLSLLRRSQAQNFGRMEQGLANAGVALSSRSAVRMLAEQRGLDKRGQDVQKYNTELEAHGYLQRSALEEHQLLSNAAMSRAQKRSATRSAGGAMLGTMIDGIGAVSNQYNQYRLFTGGGAPSGFSPGGSRGFP